MTALFGKTVDGTVRSAKLASTQSLQILKSSTSDNDEVVGQGRNGVTFNLGGDGRILIDCLVHLATLPEQGGGGVFGQRGIFIRSAEDTYRTGIKNAIIQGGVNHEGRVLFAVSDDLVLLHDTVPGLLDGTTPVLADSGNNFRWNYYRGGTQPDNLVGSFVGDGGGFPGGPSGNEHMIICMTPTDVINEGETHHIAFMADGSRLYIIVDGVVRGNFKAPAGGTGFRTNLQRANFISTSWYLGRHPVGGGLIAGTLPTTWYYGFRIWSRDIPLAQTRFLRDMPYHSQAIFGSGTDESRVVSSYAFDATSQGTIDTQDFGEANNSATFNQNNDITVGAALLINPVTAPLLGMGHGPA